MACFADIESYTQLKVVGTGFEMTRRSTKYYFAFFPFNIVTLLERDSYWVAILLH